MQQHSALVIELPACRIITLTGLDNVDKWTDQKLWDATLKDVHVVVATPAVLLDALTHAFVTISNISLLVFDEAHHATKNHPMNSICKLFYHPALEDRLPVPAILGLTASPVVNSKHGSLETLESNLSAISVTPKKHRDELERHVDAPKVEVVLYSAGCPAIPDDICSALAMEARTYDMSTDPYVVDLKKRDDDPKATKELLKIMDKGKTYCLEQIRSLDLRALTLQTTLGPSIARWYVSRCIEKFREGLSSERTVLPDLSEHERVHLADILFGVERTNTLADATMTMHLDEITEKAKKLIHTLQRCASPSLRGIVFVEQRVQVTALSELLRRIPEIQASYRIASFVGTSVSSKRGSSVADIVDIRNQQADLEAFRTGDKNLMICTSVLEEGIDVSSCNLVVCFELPTNLVSFVQRRGRARQSGSKYVLFVSQDDQKKQNRPWEILEAKMKELYMDDSREFQGRAEDESNMSDKLYRVDATGAVLTPENAKAHLYHFCSVGILDASNYVDLRPEFDATQNLTTGLWTATVDLPSFVHTSVRHATSSQDWATADMAVKDASFEAYVALHKSGLVNDNLLPLTKQYGPDTGQHLDQPSIVCVSDRKSPLALPWKSTDASPTWHSAIINIGLADEAFVEIVMWTPFLPPTLSDFVLHWNREVTYAVHLQHVDSAPTSMTAEHLNLLRATTKLLLNSVHGSRMSAEADDFPVLFAPAGVSDLDKWLREVQGVLTASDLYRDPAILAHVGLVRVASQAGRTFFLDTNQEEVDRCKSLNQLPLRSFPKRRDFLHPVTSESGVSAAYTSVQLFPLGECSVELLPARYAMFAAFAPSILHRLDTSLLAVELNNTILQNVGISDLSLVLEAISSPAAGETGDYNRLEYLGDTCLKHCTELQVMAQYPTWPESYLTVERDRMVRNTNLAKAAMDLGLDKFILAKAFTGSKWRPLYISEIASAESKERQMSTKTLADVVEALIGAAFVDGGIEKALVCIQTLLPTEKWFSPQFCFESMIGELRPSEVTNLALLEQLVGHKFVNPTLLVEAITHVSFPYNKTGLSLERLEFLGDSVLDMLVTPKLFAHPRKLRHDQMHGIHEALVNAAFLGHLCMSYEIEEEKQEVVSNGDSYEIKTSPKKLHLYDFLRCGSQLIPLKQKSLAAFEELREEIDEALANSKEYPWPALIAERPQKFFCDLVESILGALFVDTGGDMKVCEGFAARLGIFKHMDWILNDHVDTLSPKERVGILADQEAVKYESARSEIGGRKRFTCTLTMGEEAIVTVTDCSSKEEAEVKAAYKACKVLEARGASYRRKRKVDVAGLGSGDVDDAMEIDEPSEAGADEMEQL